MSNNKYEKFDNEFNCTVLPAEHENVNMSKQKNGGLRTGSSKLSADQFRDHFSDDKCAVEIITSSNCNGKKHSNSRTTDQTDHAKRFTLKSFNEFETNNLQKLSFKRRRCRYQLEHIWFRLFSISIIITYCILIAYDVFIESKHNYTPRTYEPRSNNYLRFITPFITLYFGIELCLRIYASGGITSFFSNWYNSLDWSIITIELLILIIKFVIYEFQPSNSLVCMGRLIRVYVLINLLRNNEKSILFKPTANEDQTKDQINIDLKENDQESAISNSQTSNSTTASIVDRSTEQITKVKRLITPDDFKLDLTYIKDNLIVLPCPVDNLIKLKRNQIKNLEAFLDAKYANNYKVYNLCSEQSYMDKSKSKYFHGNFVNFPIEDYGILSLSMIKEFVTNLDAYLDSSPQTVAVIHCSDGKKRTSFVVCAWLIYRKYFDRVEDAQRFFYEQLSMSKSRANNLELTPITYNLLQTPSQLRYLKYFEQLVHADMQRAEERNLHLSEIRISSLIGIGMGNGSDLYCVFQINQFEQFHMNFFQENTSDQFNTNLNCKTSYSAEQDVLTICPINCPTLTGDILVQFFCRSRSVPKPHQHCAFYFWFNTDFLDETQLSVLRFNRSQLDNAHEPNVHSIYREKFSVELTFK